MNIKRNIAGLALASLFSFSMAGTLTVNERIFAQELIDCTPGATNVFNFAPTFDYVVGSVGGGTVVSADTVFQVQYDLPAGTTFQEIIISTDLSITSLAMVPATASISVPTGGAIGDAFVVF